MVSDEESAATVIIFPLQAKCPFFLDAFNTFSLLLVFRSLIIICRAMDFLDLFCLGFTKFLESVGLGFLPNLECFSHRYFKYFFRPILFLLSFQDFNDINVRSFVVVLGSLR